jgi:hypothetical protein
MFPNSPIPELRAGVAAQYGNGQWGAVGFPI